MKTQRTGKHAEDLALQFLIEKGLLLRERNYRCRSGEIDLVMWQEPALVFVEVRYRANQDFGGALESVDLRKQAKLTRTATRYLQQHRLLEIPARIDVVALSKLDLQPDSIHWVKNAIEG